MSFVYQKFEDDDIKMVFSDLNLNVKKGEFLAVLGHNGSGKSTLAKHFNSIILPLTGDVIVKGMNTKDEEKIYDIRQSVGMVFQNPDNQIVATIVEEDVAFALENIGIEPKEIRKRVDQALKDVGMFEQKDRAPHQLSGGQKQRIAIAGIIAMRPECIVLDEPTAMLDPKGRKEVLKTIKNLNEKFGITIVLITHFMDEAAKADRVIVMNDGEIVFNNIPSKVFSEVKQMKEIGLDVPQATELAYLLEKSGFKLDGDILNEDDFVTAFCEKF
ncbi:MAG: energy-coupling factor transporter ATPase [Clostridia bacterium]